MMAQKTVNKTKDHLNELDSDPRECFYRLGSRIRKRIDAALKQEDVDPNDKKTILEALEKEETNKQLIDYETLSVIHKHLQRMDPTYNHFFYQLIDECRIVKPPSRKNEELERRVRKLKCSQANKEYNAMTSGVNASSNTCNNLSLGNELRQMRPTLIALTNALLAIGGTFFFCYKAVEYALPKPHVTAQALVGLIGALIVSIAELYFLIRII